jgi:hypothetical protein
MLVIHHFVSLLSGDTGDARWERGSTYRRGCEVSDFSGEICYSGKAKSGDWTNAGFMAVTGKGSDAL